MWVHAKKAAWPDPFDRWPGLTLDEPRAHLRLPRTFTSSVRSPLEDAVLEKLFQAVLMQDWDANQRCTFYTLAAALIICPQEVTLTRSNGYIPQYLRNIEQEVFPNEHHLCIEDVAVQRPQFCGTCGYIFDFKRIIRLRYKNIIGEFTLNSVRTVVAARWSATHQIVNYTLRHKDHTHNDFAWRLMQAYVHQYTDDLSRLKLLAFGLDALKRLLDDDHLWLEDVRVAMESANSGYGKSE
jgi:hypothetical protein